MTQINNNIKLPGVVKKYNESIVSFIFNGNHIRDRAKYDTYYSVNAEYLDGYYYTGINSDYIYNSSEESFIYSVGNGTYSKQIYNPKILDSTLQQNNTAGESDILAEIQSEVISNEIDKTISGEFLYLKTSLNKLVYSTGDEVFSNINIFDFVSTVPFNSDALLSYKNYETTADYNYGLTNSIIGGLKRFKVHSFPLDTKLVKGFSYLLSTYNEGKFYEAKVTVIKREEEDGEN